MIEYKSGTMTSKVNGDVIHVVGVESLNNFDSPHRWATEVATGYHRTYYMKHWDFKPDKISIYDLFDAFDVGTKFIWRSQYGDPVHRGGESGDEYFWLKVGKNQVVYTSNDGEVVASLLNREMVSHFNEIGWPNDTIEAI